MKILKTLKKVKFHKATALTLGFFDGVHKGHRMIISRTVKYAKRHGLVSVVYTFLPSKTWKCPFARKRPLLTSVDHRLKLIEDIGVDYCYLQDFTKAFASISAADFLDKVLFPKFKPEYICIGSNFRFGKNQKGTAMMMRQTAAKKGIRLEIEKPFRLNGRNVSSSGIRSLIEAGRIEEASKYLGRPYSVLGTVIHGKGLGRRIGFPTANLDPHNEAIPPLGVYATRTIINGKTFDSVTNIGKFKDNRIIEAHIFNFRKNLTGKDIEVLFFKKLRPEMEFESSGTLAAQIKKDCYKARNLLRSRELYYKK